MCQNLQLRGHPGVHLSTSPPPVFPPKASLLQADPSWRSFDGSVSKTARKSKNWEMPMGNCWPFPEIHGKSMGNGEDISFSQWGICGFLRKEALIDSIR